MIPLPLVSCVMPTHNRPGFVQAAIHAWAAQTYPRKELVILDDGPDPGRIPTHDGLTYIRTDEKRPLGGKRNVVNELATGEIICHWDDDDYSATTRIAHQVARLLRGPGQITGFNILLFYDLLTTEAKVYTSSVHRYCPGTTFCYWKSYWTSRPFPEIQESEDNAWLYPRLADMDPSPEITHMVARIHAQHTSRKRGIKTVVSRLLLPQSFWDNEKVRCAA